MRSLSLLLLAACSGAHPAPVDSLVVPVPEDESLDHTVSVGRVDIAQEVTDSLNAEVDPCVDFYAYACGGWVEKTPLPPDRSNVIRSFTTIDDRNEALVKSTLEEARTSTDPAMAQLGAFWTSCMDEA